MIRYPKTWKMLWPGSLWESLLFLLALSSDKIVFKIITRASNADERIFEDMEQTWTRVSNLEKSREILTSLAPSRSKKLNFHSLSLLDFQDFEEKILFLFSIYENLKHKSRSLLDLDLEFSSGSVCVWN